MSKTKIFSNKIISVLCSGVLGLGVCTNFCTNKPQAFEYNEETKKFTIDNDIAIVFICDEDEPEEETGIFKSTSEELNDYWNFMKAETCTKKITCLFKFMCDFDSLPVEDLYQECGTKNISFVTILDEQLSKSTKLKTWYNNWYLKNNFKNRILGFNLSVDNQEMQEIVNKKDKYKILFYNTDENYSNHPFLEYWINKDNSKASNNTSGISLPLTPIMQADVNPAPLN